MVERELRSKENFLNFIEETCEAKGIQITELERRAGISLGLISRWKHKGSPYLANVLKLLQLLDVKLILRTDEPEDNSGMKEENKQILDEDVLLIALVIKILKGNIDSSEKQKLCRILEVFV